MKNYSFKNARFITTAVKADGYPILKDDRGQILPEVAVAGRSNVGKSSLLNNLFQSKGLVKTSSTPGKTQALNFFLVDESLVFVDLPGYGYAEVPQKVKEQWGPMIGDYLKQRSSLKLILFLFDIRRMPNADDLQFINWVGHYEKAMIMVFTKVDKVTNNEKKANADKILRAIGASNIHTVYYSSSKNIGRKELQHMINDALQDESMEEPL